MDTFRADRDEILRLLSEHKNPVPFLQRNNPSCLSLRPLHDVLFLGEIDEDTGIEYIGRGGNAEVYRFPKALIGPSDNRNVSTSYAVKVLERKRRVDTLRKNENLRGYAFLNRIKLSRLRALNPKLNPDISLPFPVEINVGYIYGPCYLEEPRVYQIEKPSMIVTVPAGSIVCDDTYPEALIAILSAELYATGKCFHFVDTLDFISCSEDDHQYLLMEEIDSNVANEKTYTPEILIQTAVAIAAFNQEYALVHGDMISSNIFLVRNDGKISWNGRILQPTDVLEYRIGETTLYLHSDVHDGLNWLVKVGDYGLSVKYNVPIIGAEDTLKGYYVDDTGTIMLPVNYSGVYDFGIVLYNFFRDRSDKIDPWFTRVMAWFLGLPMDSPLERVQEEIPIYFNPKSYRMRVDRIDDTIFENKTAYDFLTHPTLMESYRKRPPGTTVTMAVL